MYQMPQPGGFQPQGYGYPPQGGYPPPPPPGGFNNGYNGYNNYNGYNGYNNFNNNDDESEYEYITDDEGDFVEDENGTILSMEEAQNRGLVAPAPECGERGIGKKILIGGAVLGGVWMLRKQLKKKKRVKKQKNNNKNQTFYPQQQYQTSYSNKPQQQQYQTPQNIYGQNIYGQNLPSLY